MKSLKFVIIYRANLEDGVDESSAVEIFEDKLKDAIDGLTEKRLVKANLTIIILIHFALVF